ncbi:MULTISPECIES: dTDP-4-amino-4,6-dideoxygalactose transaminase [Clostridia]|uniref:dTDP-4-amino-4,6-dideoxygalactose transaminase n=1 Tax=Clostridia TaxID=186801 RepID=UPI000EA02D60|nr:MULTISPECIES: dTDP-4-amino-4,6-dideoxygalactose transaminase [Clostridia]NBJ68280.1 dTDP-4-amino-4,6-dideoxygalactose transaminase [Roseburia sp. 1XD42-34]RKI82042.1 dTDP-4-amino-4,6-dideoxygalactose transaminase [Clostridium sp. 1xD42-85]
MIPFNKPCVVGSEIDVLTEVLHGNKLSGNGTYGEQCSHWLEYNLACERVLLTPSCTAALEMTALLMNISEGDEVIMPSYTFVSTANAYTLRGATIRFVDIDPLTMNIDPQAIEAAISKQTKAIVVVHYAGVSCDMDAIQELTAAYNLWLIEDAAQALMSTYKGKALGTIGHMGTISFHDTKNITCGEGGALLINDPSLMERAEIIQEKGTNRSQFIRGEVDKYTWRDVGSSYVLSELNAAYLFVQLNHAREITADRLTSWDLYDKELKQLQSINAIELPVIPKNGAHNAHMFFIKTANEHDRNRLMTYLKERDIITASHYVPLHSAYAGSIHGSFIGTDQYTTRESRRLLRLPLYYRIGERAIQHVTTQIQEFFQT